MQEQDARWPFGAVPQQIQPCRKLAPRLIGNRGRAGLPVEQFERRMRQVEAPRVKRIDKFLRLITQVEMIAFKAIADDRASRR